MKKQRIVINSNVAQVFLNLRHSACPSCGRYKTKTEFLYLEADQAFQGVHCPWCDNAWIDALPRAAFWEFLFSTSEPQVETEPSV